MLFKIITLLTQQTKFYLWIELLQLLSCSLKKDQEVYNIFCFQYFLVIVIKATEEFYKGADFLVIVPSAVSFCILIFQVTKTDKKLNCFNWIKNQFNKNIFHSFY